MPENSRQSLVQELESAQADFESLLEQAGPGRLDRPGVNGEWSVKDILSHMTAWEERILAWSAAIETNTQPEPPPWPKDSSEEQVNQWIYERNRYRPLQEVMETWRRVYQGVLKAISLRSDEELFDLKLSWLNGASLGESIPGNSYEHLRHHEADLRRWLQSQPG